MPLYEYRCDACGHQFELIQKFSDPPVEVCPNCGERRVQKLLSSPAIQFKGSGWYITDYARKGGEKSGDKAEKPVSSDSTSSSTDKAGSSDAKSTSSSDSISPTASKPSGSPAPSKD